MSGTPERDGGDGIATGGPPAGRSPAAADTEAPPVLAGGRRTSAAPSIASHRGPGKRYLNRPLGILAETGWLAAEPEDFRTFIYDAGRWRRYPPGEFVYEEGDEPEGLCGFAQGAVEVSLGSGLDEPALLVRKGPGFWTGELELLSGTRRLVSVRAATLVDAFVVPAETIRATLRSAPGYWRSFYALSAMNMAETQRILSETLALPVSARLARRLVAASGKDHRVSITQGDLARILGVSRSTLRRALDDLARTGAIGTGYHTIAILDRPSLERAARGARAGEGEDERAHGE